MPAATSIKITDVESIEVSTSASTKPTTTTMSTSILISYVPALSLPVTIVSSSESHTTPTSIAIASTSHRDATTVIASTKLLQPTPIFSVPSLATECVNQFTDHGVSVGDPNLRTPTLSPTDHMLTMSLEY